MKSKVIQPQEPQEPLKIVVTTGGGDDPLPVYEESVWLTGGDSITINLPDQPIVWTRGVNGVRPLRLKFRGRWYEIGKEILAP